MKTFRLGDVAQRSIDQARRAGRKPALFKICNIVPVQDPPIYRGLPSSPPKNTNL